MLDQDTIGALSTPHGKGAISIIRISGLNSFSIIEEIFQSSQYMKKIHMQASHTLHVGYIVDKKEVLDQVIISLFKAPYSYTGENIIEISCHASSYITHSILQLLIKQGVRIARPGEFTLRAFLNGKMDLIQAEGVADLIASESKVDHTLAMSQFRGGISDKIRLLRAQLVEVASLIELNLDFSEEDIEFTNQAQLLILMTNLEQEIKVLLDSFIMGNAIKYGIRVIIIGAPNVGKSTFLNTLLQEERAIVSNIPGTTRDLIEDQIIINDIRFRFVDTAGIHKTEDILEAISIKKTVEYIDQAQVIFYLFDSSNFEKKFILSQVQDLYKTYPSKTICIIANKSDLLHQPIDLKEISKNFFCISAKKKEGIDNIFHNLLYSPSLEDNTIMTSSRYYEALHGAFTSIQDIIESINKNRSGDLLAIDLRHVLHCLGTISGEVSSEELLNNIFSKFCIGK